MFPRPKQPINGSWTSWSSWSSSCESTCRKSRSRSCSNPYPMFGGEDCVGEKEEELLLQPEATTTTESSIIGGELQDHRTYFHCFFINYTSGHNGVAGLIVPPLHLIQSAPPEECDCVFPLNQVEGGFQWTRVIVLVMTRRQTFVVMGSAYVSSLLLNTDNL